MPKLSAPCPPVTLENDDWIRLLVWVVCDGTMVDHRKYEGSTCNKRRIQFKLSLPRKIEALQALLKRMGIEYTLKPATMSGINVLQPWCVRIYGDAGRAIFDYLGGVKQFPNAFRGLDERQTNVVVEEIAITDGYRKYRVVHWVTTNWHDVQVIERLCAKHSISFVCNPWINRSGFANAKPQYRVRLPLRDSRVYRVECC